MTTKFDSEREREKRLGPVKIREMEKSIERNEEESGKRE